MPGYWLLWLLPGAAIFTACVLLLRRLNAPYRRILLSAFLALGIGLGLLSVTLWPLDLGVYVNPPGAAAGDWVYRAATQTIGGPGSDQAHYTIPWVLRVPQVYGLISPMVYGVAGLIVQSAYNRWWMTNTPEEKPD